MTNITYREVNAMKTNIYLSAAAIGLCAAGAAALYFLHRKKTVQPAQTTETLEDHFLTEWAGILTEDARVFNGLYSGLQRVAGNTAKKPEKVLREWCQRTHYKWENESVDVLCREQILPSIESADADGLTKWARLLLDAAAAAGVTAETAEKIVLNESNADDYVEWDGNELYPGDEIEVITPAWNQNGKLLEQGQCRRINAAAE